MFTAVWTPQAQETFDQLSARAEKVLAARLAGSKRKSTRDEGLFKQVEKCIRLLLSDPRHPGLQTHEFTSVTHPYDSEEKVFEAYAQHKTPSAYRVFWCYGPERGEITIIAITPHP